MLRLVLLVLYLIAPSLPSLQAKQGGGGWDPLGLNAPPPKTDGEGGADPLGLRNTSTPPPQTDGGSGWDPLG